MRIVTRNLHQGGPKDFSALRKTVAGLRPDVLFIQECCDPGRYKGWPGYQAYWQCIGHGKWGSATLIRESISYEPIDLVLPEFVGWIAGGKLISSHGEILLLNIHTPTSNRSYSRLALEALAALSARIERGHAILGGDWNVTIATSVTNPNAIDLKGSRVVREALNKMKLVNAWQHLHPYDTPPRTLRYHFRSDSAPHHIDGFFLTPDLVPFLRSCEVLETEEWLDSDHNPVVMELEF